MNCPCYTHPGICSLNPSTEMTLMDSGWIINNCYDDNYLKCYHYQREKDKIAEREAAEKKAREAKEAAEKTAAEEQRKVREAAEKLRKAAEQGDAEAQFKLGNSYFTGQGETRDYAKAIEWFGKAAEQGHVEAKGMLAKAEAVVEEEKTRKAQKAARDEKVITNYYRNLKIGLVLQIVVTVISLFTFFYANKALSSIMESLPILLQFALPVGVPALLIGIITKIFRNGNGSFFGMAFIIFIDIAISVYCAVDAAKGFWGFIGWLIFGLIAFSISAIPGFFMAKEELE